MSILIVKIIKMAPTSRCQNFDRIRKELVTVMIPRLLHSLCLTLVGLYLVLVSVATFCASSHDLRPTPDHSHSKNSISHSLLCSWACQVSSKANAADSTQEALLSILLLFAGVFYGLSVFPTQAILIPLSARGPPK